MRYIGNKDKLLDFLSENILNLNLKKIDTFVDVFSGTGTVSNFFKNKFNILACELLYSSYIISKSKLELTNDNVDLKKMENLIKILNDLEESSGFIFNLYSENGESNRLYFSESNGKKIDSIICKINDLNNKKEITYNEKTYLISILLESIDKVSNITGVYGSYLKKLQNNAKKKIELNFKNLEKFNNQFQHIVHHGESYDILKDKINEKCILYLDPPYNSRQYGSNYHLLETISKLEKPVIGKSVVGLPNELPISTWCYKKNVLFNLKKFLELNSNMIVLSYNNESHINKEDLIKLMSEYGNVSVKEIEYKKFKSNNKETNKQVLEYLFICDKRDFIPSIKSPIQWVGGKSRILNEIKKYIPDSYNNYFELFLGGGSLLFNLKNNNSFCTEINYSLCKLYNDININCNDLIKELDNIQKYYNSLILEHKKKYYIDIRNKYNKIKKSETNSILLSTYFIFLNRTCFNALYRENSRGDFNVPFGNGKNIELYNYKNIKNLSNFLKNIEIKNENYEYYINKITDKDFVYIDPPYYNTFTTYNKTKWTNEDDINVIKIFNKLSKNGIACILSNSNNSEYLLLLSNHLTVDYKVIVVELSRSLNSNAFARKKTPCEIIIINKFCNNW